MWFGVICHYLMIISPPRIKTYLKNPAASDAGLFALHTNGQLVIVSTSKDQLRNNLLSSFHVAGNYSVHILSPAGNGTNSWLHGKSLTEC